MSAKSGRAARRAANKRLSKDPAETTRMVIPEHILALAQEPRCVPVPDPVTGEPLHSYECTGHDGG